MTDPERFDAGPDPDTSFHADVDPDPAPDPNPDPKKLLDGKRIKKFFKSSTIFSKIFQNLSCQIFSVTMREEG